jgi:hypothetical protein
VEACVLRSWLRNSGMTHLHAHFGTNAAAVAMLCKGRLGWAGAQLTDRRYRAFGNGSSVQETALCFACPPLARLT